MELGDVPITKGIQERMTKVPLFEEPFDLSSVQFLAKSRAALPGLSADVVAMLPTLLGALLMAAAETMTVMHPGVVNPTTAHWEQVAKVMDILL